MATRSDQQNNIQYDGMLEFNGDKGTKLGFVFQERKHKKTYVVFILVCLVFMYLQFKDKKSLVSDTFCLSDGCFKHREYIFFFTIIMYSIENQSYRESWLLLHSEHHISKPESAFALKEWKVLFQNAAFLLPS